LPNICDTG